MSARLFRHELVDSTNERALEALARGQAHHLDAHVAEGQSAGRGRLGRSWASARGEGLYLSLVLLPDAPPNPAALTMGAGLAVLAAARALGAAAARLKWPNDVLVADAKLAGILVESRGHARSRPHAVVGVGLNVRQRAFPPELLAERAVTSLALLALDVPLERALATLLAELRPRLQTACADPALVATDYARALGLLDRSVSVTHGSSETHGRLHALTLAGLELALDDGRRTLIALEHACTVAALP